FLRQGRTLPQALRIARHAVVERLVALDVERAAPLDAVTSAMTALAEVALERALAQALRDEGAQHGAPLDASGQRIDFWIVGMASWGRASSTCRPTSTWCTCTATKGTRRRARAHTRASCAWRS